MVRAPSRVRAEELAWQMIDLLELPRGTRKSCAPKAMKLARLIVSSDIPPENFIKEYVQRLWALPLQEAVAELSAQDPKVPVAPKYKSEIVRRAQHIYVAQHKEDFREKAKARKKYKTNRDVPEWRLVQDVGKKQWDSLSAELKEPFITLALQPSKLGHDSLGRFSAQPMEDLPVAALSGPSEAAASTSSSSSALPPDVPVPPETPAKRWPKMKQREWAKLGRSAWSEIKDTQPHLFAGDELTPCKPVAVALQRFGAAVVKNSEVFPNKGSCKLRCGLNYSWRQVTSLVRRVLKK